MSSLIDTNRIADPAPEPLSMNIPDPGLAPLPAPPAGGFQMLPLPVAPVAPVAPAEPWSPPDEISGLPGTESWSPPDEISGIESAEQWSPPEADVALEKIRSYSPEKLAEMAEPERQALWAEVRDFAPPDDLKKLADASAKHRAIGLTPKIVAEGVAGTLGTLWKMGTSLVQAGWSATHLPGPSDIKKILKATSKDEALKILADVSTRSDAELVSGLSTASANAVILARDAIREIVNFEPPVGKALGIPGTRDILSAVTGTDLTKRLGADVSDPENFLEPEDNVKRFLNDFDAADAVNKTAEGQSVFSEWLGMDAAELKKQDIEINPEAIEGFGVALDITNLVPALGALKSLKVVKLAGVGNAAARSALVDEAGKVYLTTAKEGTALFMAQRLAQKAAAGVAAVGDAAAKFGKRAFQSKTVGAGAFGALAAGHAATAGKAAALAGGTMLSGKAVAGIARMAGSQTAINFATDVGVSALKGAKGGLLFGLPLAALTDDPEKQVAMATIAPAIGGVIGGAMGGATGIKRAALAKTEAINRTILKNAEQLGDVDPAQPHDLAVEGHEAVEAMHRENQSKIADDNSRNRVNIVRRLAEKLGRPMYVVTPDQFAALGVRAASGVADHPINGKPAMLVKLNPDGSLPALGHELAHPVLDSFKAENAPEGMAPEMVALRQRLHDELMASFRKRKVGAMEADMNSTLVKAVKAAQVALAERPESARLQIKLAEAQAALQKEGINLGQGAEELAAEALTVVMEGRGLTGDVKFTPENASAANRLFLSLLESLGLVNDQVLARLPEGMDRKSNVSPGQEVEHTQRSIRAAQALWDNFHDNPLIKEALADAGGTPEAPAAPDAPVAPVVPDNAAAIAARLAELKKSGTHTLAQKLLDKFNRGEVLTPDEQANFDTFFGKLNLGKPAQPVIAPVAPQPIPPVIRGVKPTPPFNPGSKELNGLNMPLGTDVPVNPVTPGAPPVIEAPSRRGQTSADFNNPARDAADAATAAQAERVAKSNLPKEAKSAFAKIAALPGALWKILHEGAKNEEGAAGMLDQRRRQVIQAARDNPALRDEANKYGWMKKSSEVTSGGEEILVGFNGEALLANALLAVKEIGFKKVPYLKDKVVGGELTGEGLRAIREDQLKYLQNQNAGFGGDGSKLVRGKETAQHVPAEDPNYTPQQLSSPDALDFINLTMGENTPISAKVYTKGTPVPILAADFAKANKKVGTPALGKDGQPLIYAKEPFAGQPIEGFNKLRADLEAQGVNFRDLKPASERLNVKNLRGAEVMENVSGMKPNVSVTTAAGFMAEKRAIQIEGPDGKMYDATFDGWQDFGKLKGWGQQAQITTLEKMPGFSDGTTTYEAALREAGYKVQDFGKPQTLKEDPAAHVPGEVSKRPDDTALKLPTPADAPVKLAGDDIGLTPARFMAEKVSGSEHTEQSPSYPDAIEKAKARGGNAWVRQTDSPTNADRVLLVQFAPELMYPNGPDPISTPYYEKLYSGVRKGFDKAPTFWEIPQWAAVAKNNLAKSDFYAVHNVAEAKAFLEKADYGRVAFSVMDVSKALTEELVPHIKGEVDLGGYTDRTAAAALSPKSHIWNSMNEFVEAQGVKYQKGFDYAHFRGTPIIPRMELSAGCRHKCTFCTIDRKVTNSPVSEVNAQVDSFSDLNAKLVYLNDKTFGQSPNVAEMPRIFKQMKEANPEFEGFVIQTTAAQMKLFKPEFLKEAGIKYVELGVESYNDSILKPLRKPANEKLIDEAVTKLRETGVNFIPNIVIGFPEETAATYAHTMDFLRKNEDIISHVNVYNLAVYEGTEISGKIKTKTAGDVDENTAAKSFHKDPALHAKFAKDVYDFATERLGKPAAFMAEKVARERTAEAHPSLKDETGMPKMFYHGSFKSKELIASGGWDIDKTKSGGLFGKGFYFTDNPGVAGGVPWRNSLRKLVGKSPEGYAMQPTSTNSFFEQKVNPAEGTPGVFPAYLDLRNPFIADKTYTGPEALALIEKLPPLPEGYGTARKFFERTLADAPRPLRGTDLFKAVQEYAIKSQKADEFLGYQADPSGASLKGLEMAPDRVVRWMQEAGYDGVTYLGGVTRKATFTSLGEHAVAVAFAPEQIISPYEKPGSEPGRFMAEKGRPLTEAGEALERKGLFFTGTRDPKDGLTVLRYSNSSGEPVADISFRAADGAKSATVNMVFTDETYRRLGLAEALTREMGARLQEAGVTDLKGTAVSNKEGEFPAIGLRKKVFGNVEIRPIKGLEGTDKTVGMQDIRSKVDPNQKFMAEKTQATKEIESSGLEFSEKGNTLKFKDGKKTVAYLRYSVNDGEAYLDETKTDAGYRRRGLAEALYRELGSRLQKSGITVLDGDVISEAPLHLRKKVFGNVQESGKELTLSVPEPLLNQRDALLEEKRGLEKVLLDVENEITRAWNAGERKTSAKNELALKQAETNLAAVRQRVEDFNRDNPGVLGFQKSPPGHDATKKFDDHVWMQVSSKVDPNQKFMAEKTWITREGEVVDAKGDHARDAAERHGVKITNDTRDKSVNAALDKGEVQAELMDNTLYLFADAASFTELNRRQRAAIEKAALEGGHAVVYNGKHIEDFGPAMKFMADKATNSRGLPPAVEKDVRRAARILRASEQRLRDLPDGASLEQRDAAVGSLSKAEQLLNDVNLNYDILDFPALEWVRKSLREHASDLTDLLNTERRPAITEDAALIGRLADGMDDLLKPASKSFMADKSPTVWITPDGKKEPLGGVLHEHYLAQNSDKLNKKFGTKFSGEYDEAQRLKALNAGFVRVRSSGQGDMTVELNERFWGKRKAQLLAHALDNVAEMNSLTVDLLTDKGKHVAGNYADVYVSKDPSQAIRDVFSEMLLPTGKPTVKEPTAIQRARAMREPQYMADKVKAPVVEDQLELGKPAPPIDRYNREFVKSLTLEQKKEHFPEAVVTARDADGTPPLIGSDIVGSPMVKKYGEAAAIKKVGDKLAARYEEFKNDPAVELGRTWYSRFTGPLKKHFGKDASLFAELLAATSPQTQPKQNFETAYHAFELYKAGWFDDLVAGFIEGLDKIESGVLYQDYVDAVPASKRPAKISDETLLGWWIDSQNLRPTKAPRLKGKSLSIEDEVLFNANSVAVLKVAARKWMTENTGPKTSQFVRNLLGLDHGATIDLWADRSVREAAYSDFEKRWRILPENTKGVSDVDFDFSQAAFKHGADKLGMKPSELQGALWFLEKRRWAEKGWSQLNLGDYLPHLQELVDAGPLSEALKNVPISRAKALADVVIARKQLVKAKAEVAKIEHAEDLAIRRAKSRQETFALDIKPKAK
jgi:ribosomal protein S18 acetylase RimI-like enzyme